MKKVLAIVMSIVFVVTCGLCAVATGEKEETLTAAGTSTQDVHVQVVDKNGNPLGDDDVPAVYMVKVNFDNLHFNFKSDVDSGSLVWDGTKYSNLTGSWTNNDQKVKVTNLSNRAVNISAAFANKKTTSVKNNVTASVNCTAATKLVAASDATATADNTVVSYTVSVAGTPTIFGDFTVDTLVVNFAEVKK